MLLVLFLTEVADAAHPYHKYHRHGWRSAAYAPPPASVSFQVFYDNLAPYGSWINDPMYGYVWVPNVGSGFRPYYTDGYWAMTEYGNTWVSNYPWGWAPFHYGRWTYDNWYGWIWIPDNVWGPAWVAWRTGPDYYGWAPLAPGFGFAVNTYYFPNDWWVFCPPRYVYTPTYYNYCAGPTYNTTIINNTTIVNNTVINNNNTYIAGPGTAEFEKRTNQRLPVYNVKELDRPTGAKVDNSSVALYRPDVSKAAQDKQAAPSKVVATDRAIGKPQAISGGTSPKFNPNGAQIDNRQNATQPNGLQPGGMVNPSQGSKDVNRNDVDQRMNPQQNQGGKVTPRQMDQGNPQRNAQPQQNSNDRLQPWKQPQQVEPKRQPDVQPRPNNVEPRGQQQQMQPRQEQQRLEPRGQQPQVQPRQQQEQPRQMEPQRQQPQMQPRQEPQRLEPRGNQQMEPRQMQPRQEPQQMQPRQTEPQRQQPQMQPRQEPQRLEPRGQQQTEPRQIQPRQEPQQMQPRGNNGKPGLAPR